MKYYIGTYSMLQGGNLLHTIEVHAKVFWDDKTKRRSYTGDKEVIKYLVRNLRNRHGYIYQWYRNRLKIYKQKFKEL